MMWSDPEDAAGSRSDQSDVAATWSDQEDATAQWSDQEDAAVASHGERRKTRWIAKRHRRDDSKFD